MNIQNHLSKLGHKCEDKVTTFKGVITSITFDLYGCIQALVNPGLNKDGDTQDSRWFDMNRLKITSDTPVMEQPDYVTGITAEGKKGPAEKPRTNMKP